MSNVSGHHFHEIWVAFGGPDAERVGDQPIDNPDDPKLEPEAQSRAKRAIENGRHSGGAAHQDGLGQRPMDRY